MRGPWSGLGLPRGGAVRSLQALLVASCLVAGLSAAGGEPRRERVPLAVEARPREEDAQRPRLEVWREGGVLSLRVVDPGRLVVKAGARVIAVSALGWGEDGRLRLEPLAAHPPTALPRVVNREPGREEVEVHVPTGVGAGGLLTLTYEWDCATGTVLGTGKLKELAQLTGGVGVVMSGALDRTSKAREKWEAEAEAGDDVEPGDAPVEEPAEGVRRLVGREVSERIL
jgi:hypothetical protein